MSGTHEPLAQTRCRVGAELEAPRTVMAQVAGRRLLEGGRGAQPSGSRASGLILVELKARRLARAVRPGQFVRVRHGREAQPFHVATRWQEGIGLLVRPGWGIATQVAALKPGERLELTGPLGRPFAPVHGRPVWHLAGPGRLHALLLASRESDPAAPVFLSEVGRRQPPPWWTAEAGAAAAGGGNTPVQWLPLGDLAELEARLNRLPPAPRPILRAAGSMDFLILIARLARRYRLSLQVTVEQPMPCGLGVCLGCVVPRRGGEGTTRWARSCREGPVFDAEELDWDRLAGSPIAGAPTAERRPPIVTVAARGKPEEPAEEPGLPDGPLNTRIGRTWLRNPLMPASGCFGYGREMASLYPLRLLGAVVTKGVSPRPWEGRHAPRMAWTGGGLLNAIGLQNPGVERFLEEELPFLVDQGAAVVVNVVGQSVQEYAAVAARLEGAPRFPDAPGRGVTPSAARPYSLGHGGLVALELNISCPNVDAGGLHFGQDPASAARVVRAVRLVSSLPLWVKLSPQGPVMDVARAVLREGAAALSAANTLPGLALDPRSGRPRVAGGSGGLSGPPLKPVNLMLVQRLRRELEVPIIGIGGIRSLEDVLEYRQAGAAAVAVGSAHFSDPYVLLRLRRDLLREAKAWSAAGRREEAGRCDDGRG